MSLGEALISVWRQSLVEEVEAVKLNGRRFPVRRTPKKWLRQVDFNLDDRVDAWPRTESGNFLPMGANSRRKVTGSCSSPLKAATLQTLVTVRSPCTDEAQHDEVP